MKKIGILGGVGWASTVDYYRALCQGANAHFAALGETSPLPAPPITIESVVQAQTRKLRGVPGDDASWAGFDAVFRQALLRLQEADCDFAIIASNTPHMRLSAITDGVDMPVLSIFDATAEAAKAAGASQALVLGTRVTMQSDAYAQALAARGVSANARLPEGEIDAMQDLIDTAFYGGAAPDATSRLLEICARHAGPETLIALACTELPLAFPDNLDDAIFTSDGFWFLNPSAAHLAAALAKALN